VTGDLVASELTIRPYEDTDEQRVLELISGSLGGGPAGRRPPEYFRWKHLQNPFGRSFMILAEYEGELVGFRALMRWRFAIGDRRVEAVRPVDTVTHPDHRGRGVFSTLTRTALDRVRDEVDLVFNTPNQNSLPGYVKMGWQVAGTVPFRVAVRRPLAFARSRLRRGAPTGGRPRPAIDAAKAAEVLADGESVAALVREAEVSTWGYATPRDVGYLRWRYGEAPVLDYHAIAERRRGDLVGLAVFRLRPEGGVWGASIGDVIVRPGDVGTARRLLREVAHAADVTYLAMTIPAATTVGKAASFPRTIKAPRGMTFVVNPLTGGLTPDPTRLASWALWTGDVEVF
jgi:GNAT superfamily N-acetyltransferase